MSDDLQTAIPKTGQAPGIAALPPLTVGDERYPRFRMTSASGLVADVLTLGATLSQVWLPGQRSLVPVTCGPTVAALQAGNPAYLGAVIGRYSNRIGDGSLTVNGHHYQLSRNSDGQHLHGGTPGFHRKRWDAQISADGCALQLSCHSPAGEAGYPGAVDARATYQLQAGILRLRLEAEVSGAATPVSMTSHCYWQLAGAGNPAACSLSIPADRVLETTPARIPTGRLLEVAGTALDLRSPRTLSPADDLALDHCYVTHRQLPGTTGKVPRVATLRHAESGRTLHVHSTQPTLQCYSGDQLDGSAACGQHPARAGLCLEPQQYPDAPNQPGFPGAIVAPGEVYRHDLQLHFSWPD
jgi:aldose 1-epimerase